MAKKTVYQLITEQIVALLDRGEIPWRKPWKFATHMNGLSGYRYKGINPLVLDCVATLNGYSSNLWFTYKQMTDNGGSLRTDERQFATKVVYWNLIFEKDEYGQPTNKVAFAKPIYHNMFNMDQIEWEHEVEFASDDSTQNPDTLINPDEVQHMFDAMSEIEIKHGGGRAYYSPRLDYIGMPNPEQFESDHEYWSTLYHEWGHATGSEDRLGRFTGDASETQFGSQSYSFEELIAEFTAAFMCAKTGIDDLRVLENSAAYIQGWKNRLLNNPNWWSKAATQAQRATEYILGTPEPVEN